MIKILELFSGYGTATFALKQLGLEHEIVGYSDIDKYANKCFQQNHGGKELGDASVPFSFDVHAMIYSVDAPTLEKKLHRKFENYRVNKVNLRKEFFKVKLDEIEKEARKNNSDFYLTKIAEAQEYRETQTMG